MNDTSEEAAEAQREVFRRMGPERRLALCFQLSEEVRELAIQGEMQRHPGMSRDTARLEVFRRMYGDELYMLAFGSRR